MRTLWLASPDQLTANPAPPPTTGSICGPGVTEGEHLLCSAPQAAAGSLLFGPSDPFSTRVTRSVLVGLTLKGTVCEFAFGALLVPVRFGVCTRHDAGSLLHLPHPQPNPSLVLFLFYLWFSVFTCFITHFSPFPLFSLGRWIGPGIGIRESKF